MDDWELLQNYAHRGSEAAFRTLLERYLNLVHSVAMRQVRQAQLAEEVSQAVFILLARKARSLKPGIVLSGWLFRTTRFVASRAQRAELRRQKREQEACEMQQSTTTDETWRLIGPMLDEALEHLGTTDRNLMLLRFYEGKNHKEAGAAVGLSEEAARKRGTRALDRLRDRFTRRGATLSAAALAAVLATNAVQAAPANAAEGIAVAVAGKSGTMLPMLVQQTLNAWRWSKAKVAASWLTAAVGAALLIAVTRHHAELSPGTPDHRARESDGLLPNIAAATTEPVNRPAAAKSKASSAMKNARVLRFHVLAKDSGEPVAGARLAVRKVPHWEQTYDSLTDDDGVCEIPLTDRLGRLDVGLLSPGWGARFVTWKGGEDKDPIPADYTLQVERATNSLGGWLRDPGGNPVSGATVVIQFGGTGDASWRETPREGPGVTGEAPVAITDKQGHWTCSVVPGDNPGFNLEAMHPDFAATAIASSFPGGTKDHQENEAVRQLWAGILVTTMSKPLDVRGHVTDRAGKPVGDAKVDHHPAATDALRVKTDAGGNFIFPKLKPGSFDFAISAEGFAPEYREVEAKAGLDPVEIVLQLGAVLRLRIVDHAGREVPDATVGMEQWGDHRYALSWSAQSGPDGRIEWNSAPRGEVLELYARKHGWCYTRYVRVTATGEEHKIEMMPALTLSGRVTDADTGAAVENFKVVPGYGEGRGEQVWERLETRPGANGQFEIVFGESQQPWQLRVEAAGYVPSLVGPIPPDFFGVYELALKRSIPETAMRGVVLLPNGAPAAGARVALLTLDYHATLRPPSFRDEGYGTVTNTDAAGNFAFAANPRAHSVAAVGEAGFVKLRVKSVIAPVTLKLQPWGRLEGIVAETARTMPLENLALMDVTSCNYPGAVTLDLNAFMPKPDADGHFVFERVPAGWFSLCINRRMGTPMVCDTEVEIRPGETTQVTLGGSGRLVIGRLVLPEGQPAAWTKPGSFAVLNTKKSPDDRLPEPPPGTEDDQGLWAVDFWQSSAGRNYYRRNSGYGLAIENDGSFRIEGVPPGTYDLVVIGGNASLNKEVTVPEADASGKPLDLGSLMVAKPGDSASAAPER